MQMRQRDVAALDAKYTKELADEAGNDALRDDAAGRRRLYIKAVCQSVREATTLSGVDNAASPTGRHRWNGLFHPQREADHHAKQLEGTQKYINELVQIELPISMGNFMQLLYNTHALPAEYKCLKGNKKPSNPFTNVCWVSVLILSRRHKILLHRQFSSAQFQKTKK